MKKAIAHLLCSARLLACALKITTIQQTGNDGYSQAGNGYPHLSPFLLMIVSANPGAASAYGQRTSFNNLADSRHT
ncbi:hypothetical protein PVT67_17540 [Gallaecimonas kandeliae]|uniref:hypothetical protein n=1 Tax=Gallaecimonas kandeliae TaxID=3029055 RepID=UPI002648B656|nr:hypothetical protein [Gallaecimonas kandeliae]WKE65447.1 hypothetical protein PVT67_17540 [Gallaecimonas kandeliae]